MKCRFVWTLLVPSLAFATNITVSFSGVTTNSLPGIAVGTQFTGSVTYTTTGVQVGAGVTSANYDLTDPANYLVLNIGSYVFSAQAGNSQGLNMFVGDGPPSVPYNGDLLQISAVSGFNGVLSTNYSGLTFDSIAANFGGDLSFLTSTAIPDPFNLADLWLNSPAYTNFGIQTSDGVSNIFLNGVLTNASVSETPEPEALWLLGIGLILLGVARVYLYPRLPGPNKQIPGR